MKRRTLLHVQKKMERVAQRMQNEISGVFARSGVEFQPDASSTCSSSDDEMPQASLQVQVPIVDAGGPEEALASVSESDL